MKQASEWMSVATIGLLLIASGAVVATGAHLLSLHGQLKQTEQAAAKAETTSTQSLLQGFSLPANKRLSLCNRGRSDIRVVALTAIYWGADGGLTTFSSADHDWHEWNIAGGGREELQLDDPQGAGWDGSAIFFATEVQRPNNSLQLLSGTLNDENGGCAAVVTE